MVKVLFCIQDFRGRGAERVLSILLKYFNRDTFNIGVFVLNSQNEYELPTDIVQYPAKLDFLIDKKGLYNLIKSFVVRTKSLIKTLKVFQPDIIVSIAGTNEIAIMARFIYGKKIPVIISEHSTLSRLLRDSKKGLSYKLKRFLISGLYPRAAKILVPANCIKDNLASEFNVPKEKILMIPNPLESNSIIKESLQVKECSLEPSSLFTIGFIGSLSEEKNVQCLIRACAKVMDKGVPFRCIILGDGKERQFLTSLSQELNMSQHIQFFGFQKNPYCYLASFDVLVLPSFHEALPYVILEAMICGKPVVTSAWAGCTGSFTDRENCLIFPMNDHEKLAFSILEIYENAELRNNLLRNAEEYVAQYDARLITKKYEDVLLGFVSQ